MAQNTFLHNLLERRHTVDSLIEESRTDVDFFLFLSFAAFITTLGLHIDNPIVVVGAMLVAPILVPILALGMGIVTMSRGAIARSFKILVQSALVVVGISFGTSFLVTERVVTEQIRLVSSPDLLFFFIAFFSGIVASYAWAKQSISEALPGVAITVSLVPPLSGIGIALALGSMTIFWQALVLFLVNFVGISVASVIVFSFLGFANMQKWEEDRLEEEEALTRNSDNTE